VISSTNFSVTNSCTAPSATANGNDTRANALSTDSTATPRATTDPNTGANNPSTPSVSNPRTTPPNPPITSATNGAITADNNPINVLSRSQESRPPVASCAPCTTTSAPDINTTLNINPYNNRAAIARTN
jgi:hypothetical protein